MKDPQELSQKQEPCYTFQPCTTDQPAGTWLGEAALPTPTPVGPGVQLSSSHVPSHLPWGQQDQGWGWGAVLGAPAVQALEWQILQPGAPDRSPSPSLIYTPGTLAW